MSRLPGPGETFGRYLLERELGQGGMGVVYAALDTVLGRRVALKIVAPHLARDEEFRTRFAREAATQARLDSAHVVSIYDHGEHDGVLYISTQLIDGVDLATLVAERGALDPATAVAVTEQLLAGLADAHRADVVHRDVKPANVLVTEDGAAYLCDFGIATTAGQGLTRTGQVIGSLPWMAPERHYGQDAGAAGDVYSAGCLFWYALTGAAPYVGSDGEVMRGHLDGLAPQLLGTTPFAKKANAVLLKALAKEPEERYASAAVMAADLRALVSGAPAAVEAAEAAPTTLRSAATRPATAAAAAGAAATGAVATAGARRRWALPALVAASLLAAVAGGLGVRALTSDDTALVAGATTIEVAGRTVTMQPTHTLSPMDPSTREGTGGDVGGDVGLGLGGSRSTVTGTGVDAGTRAGTSGGSLGSTSGGAVSAPTTRSTPTAVAKPHYDYRCWDSASHLTNDLSSCGLPVGRAGGVWMQSALTSKCWKASASSPLVESYGCSVAGGVYYIAQVTNSSDGAVWLRQRMPDNRIANDWYTGSVRAGTAYQGTAVISSTKRYRWGAVYAISGGSWVVFVDATSSDGRLAGRRALDGHYRHINWVRGEPCSQTTCVGNG